MTLHPIPLNFLKYEENFIIFLSVYTGVFIDYQNNDKKTKTGIRADYV